MIPKWAYDSLEFIGGVGVGALIQALFDQWRYRQPRHQHEWSKWKRRSPSSVFLYRICEACGDEQEKVR